MSVVDRTREVKREIHRRAAIGMTVAGGVAVDTAVGFAPHREGFLRKGIFAEKVSDDGKELRIRIIDTVEYADAQERGPAPGSKKAWKFTPHMRPMVDFMQTKFQDIIDKAVFGK